MSIKRTNTQIFSWSAHKKAGLLFYVHLKLEAMVSSAILSSNSYPKLDFLHEKGRKPSVQPQKVPVEVQHGSGRSTMKLLRHPSSNPHHSPPGGNSAVALLAHPPFYCLEVNGLKQFWRALN